MKAELLDDEVKRFTYLLQERYRIKLRREAGVPQPWTEDPILQRFHFCNVFRRDDISTVRLLDVIHLQRGQRDRFLAAMIGRVLNRADNLAEVMDAVRHGGLQRAIYEARINHRAYKLHTPLGLCSRKGMMILIERALLKWPALEDQPGVKEAIEWMHREIGVGPFIAYQVVLDLMEVDYWKSCDFDDRWALVGIGAVRGLINMCGLTPPEGLDKRAFNAPNKILPMEDAQTLMHELASKMNDTAVWPPAWPTITVHEIEFMLCEYDKYTRCMKGAGRPRLYRGRVVR